MQKAMLNIPSYIEDPSYRYKMPKLVTKIEGKGNGIKTNIPNLSDVAKSLRTLTEYPLKFMAHELGTQMIFKEKGNEITSIISGSFQADDLQQLLDKFIEKYVLCSKCKYPEMVLKVKKSLGIIYGSCAACGCKSELDNKHKVANYILKNPPKNKSEFKKGEEGKEKSSKKEGKSKKDKKRAEETEEQTEEVVETETKKTVFSFDEMNEVLKEVYEGLDKENTEETFEENSAAVSTLLKKLKTCEETDPNKLYYLLFKSIFTVNIAKQVSKNSYILSRAIEKFKFEGQWAEVQILVSLELFLLEVNKETDFTKYIPTILKFFYDEDLLTEEFLVAWDEGTVDLKEHPLYNEEIDARFKQAAKAFTEWLKNSE